MKETWRVYDSNLEDTGRTMLYGEKLEPGFYHLSAEIWIVNSKKEVLLLRSTYDYTRLYPGFWKCLTANVRYEEDIYSCIKRCAHDKLNYELNLDNIKIIGPTKRLNYQYAYHTCIIKMDIDLNEMHPDDNLYMDYKFVDLTELKKKCNNGEIAYYLVERIENEVIPNI